MIHKEIKYPIGVQSFRKMITNGYLYVDKTELVYQLTRNHNCIFLSRPRRFGKSLLTSTLESYFKGEKELFENLKISMLETEWKKYPVLHFDLSAENYNHPDRLIQLIESHLSKIEQDYSIKTKGSISNRFRDLIRLVYETTGKEVVILIDEYDKPMLDCLDNEAIQNNIKDELRGFYSVIKSSDQYLRFAFLTGITRFSKVSVFSGLNNLNDISLRPEYNSLCGISETEIHQYFQDSVEIFAMREKTSEEEVWNELKTCYDGYHFARNGENIYNPISVIKTFEEGEFRDYWFETGQPNFIFNLLKKYSFEIDRLDGCHRNADQLGDSSTITTDIVPLLYQAGYLTIKEYNRSNRQYALGFPNKEVSGRFWDSLAKNFFPHQTENGLFSLRLFINDIELGKPKDLMMRLKSLFAGTCSEMESSKEIHFQNMMAIFTQILGFTIETEKHSSQGRCDMILKTSSYIYIFEFKVDSSPEKALAQIYEKGYYLPFEIDPRTKFLIGANFSSSTRTLDSWLIEKL